LAVVTPIALWRHIYSGLFSVWLIPSIVHLFAAFYSMSRGTWASLFLSSVIAFGILLAERSKERAKLVLRSFCGMLMVLSLYSLFYFSNILPQSEYTFEKRVHTLLTLSDYRKEQSMSLRKKWLKQSFEFFSENPFLGIGTSNFLARTARVPHNDYMQISSEHGILGISLFLIAIFLVVKEVFKPMGCSWEVTGLKHSALTIIFYMAFIDAYKMSMIYIVFAFLLGLRSKRNIEREEEEEKPIYQHC
jgi:O-antigen ligase